MKILNKLLLTGAVFATAGILNVNATTYAGTKKYDFKEIESNENFEGLLKYNGKSYGYFTNAQLKLHEMIDSNNKITTSVTDFEYNVIDTIYPNQTITNYYYNSTDHSISLRQTNLNWVITSSVGGVGSGVIEDYESHLLGQYVYHTFRNNILIINELQTAKLNDKEMHAYTYYNTDGEFIKNIKEQDLIQKTGVDSSKIVQVYSHLIQLIQTDKDDNILLCVEYTNENNESTKEYFIFNINEDLIISFTEEKELDFITNIYMDNEDKFLYQVCDNTATPENPELDFINCEIKTISNNGTKKSLLNSKEYIYLDIANGFIYINSKDENELSINRIYDNNFNFIMESEDGYITIKKEISNLKDAQNMRYSNSSSVYKEVQNGNYLISTYEGNESLPKKQMLMTVENSKTTTISGVLKNKEGKALKDYKVELHSIVRTTTTDENGYFKFDNVEEGKHTLTIKKSDGTIIVTKEINVYASTETKLEEDTLYFNQSDTGLNFEIKIDGENLSIDKVEPGNKTKEEAKEKVEEAKEKVEEAKEDTTVNPKTFDSILKNSIIVLLLISLSMIIIKKKSRIKVAHIK